MFRYDEVKRLECAASSGDFVTAYRSQSHIEADFRQMKDPHVVVREADCNVIHMSVRKLLDTLVGIGETVLLYQGDSGRPRARRRLTETTPTQDALHHLFDLDTYAPTP